MKLTARTVRALPPVEKPKVHFDSDLKGFGVRCMPPSSRSPAGSASWIVEYRPGAGGRRIAKRRITLGSVTEIEAAEARARAKDLLAGVRMGDDPAAGRREERVAPTVGELSLRYQSEAAPGRKPRTTQLYASYWNRWILPELGNVKARDVTRSDVAKLHRKIGAVHPITANRCVTVLAHFYTWAANHDAVPNGVNPATGASRYPEQARERYLTTTELKRLGAALALAETEGVPWKEPEGTPSKHRPRHERFRRSKISAHTAAAIKLLILTGARLREILHLRWEEVDLERGILLIPDSKTGRKTIVLGAAALNVIANLERTGTYVIAGDDPDKPRSDLNRPWVLVCRAAGLQGVRLHDLRHTFASFGASGGLGLPIIGSLLGHASTQTTARYAHLANDPVRRAADAISSEIAAAIANS